MAREAALDRLGHPEVLRATLRAWTQRLLVALVAVTAASVLLREQIATLHRRRGRAVGGRGDPADRRAVDAALAAARRAAGPARLSPGRRGRSSSRPSGGWSAACCSWRSGLGVTGALLGTPFAFVLVAVWLERVLHRVVGPLGVVERAVRTLRSLVGDGWVPSSGSSCSPRCRTST